MSTGVIPAIAPANSSTRRVPRYKLAVPLALTVLRSGIPNTIAGSTLEIGEGGMGVVPSSRLLVGESVRVEFLVPHTTSPVRATAVSVNLFCIHFFGDTFSPQIIGAIGDRVNLRIGMGATLVFLVISCVILLIGSRFAPGLEEPAI